MFQLTFKAISFINTMDARIKSIVTVMESTDALDNSANATLIENQKQLIKGLEDQFDKKLSAFMSENSVSTPGRKLPLPFSPIVDQEVIFCDTNHSLEYHPSFSQEK